MSQQDQGQEQPSAAELVIVDHQDILKDPSDCHSLATQLEQAFGNGRLGLIAIRNVPEFVDSKKDFLPQAHALAHLDASYLEQELTDPTSLYNAGWSHGKEKLGDKPDMAKGSFYFNPLTDTPGTEQDRKKFPASYPCNLWPDKDCIPNFESNAKRIGIVMKDVCVHLSKHIDAFAKQKVGESYPTNALCNAMLMTEKAKGRLLYYFPLAEEQEPTEDSWIGWHNDSGFLTALAGDLYVDDKTGKAIDCPDPQAGLYVVDRNNQVTHVQIPADCMAVQLGECVQILTGGAVVATPHCVRGAAAPGVARISLPCFIDTPPDFALRMPRECTQTQVLEAGVGSSRVPPLSTRWTEDGMPFGEFLQTTFAQYYEWGSKQK